MGRRNSPLARPCHADVVCPPAVAPASGQKSHPLKIHFFSAQAIVQIANTFANGVQNRGCLQRHDTGFYGLNSGRVNKQLLSLKPILDDVFGRFLWMHHRAVGVLVCGFCGVHYLRIYNYHFLTVPRQNTNSQLPGIPWRPNRQSPQAQPLRRRHPRS